KAGFFKAKYNNWIVADFRPERSPLKNLAVSLCKQLKLDDKLKTEKELGYGFSALCDLYKTSSFYIDESKNGWQQADEKERKLLKRRGANLLILVDQFEEFFTNPENYKNGIPSIESQKTINLLLETYKIATANDLPIYVVCTMRSDYIGQCSSFRGLPEAIGYSQFFVPRLKRQEIEQVIEGPAALAGCSISKRLTQTLINSLIDGIDQLPILQHALHQIWKTAANGNEEMDLIHLAKVGGISPKLLTIADRKLFQEWIEIQPKFKLQFFEKPNLNNVLNAHANELLFSEDQFTLSFEQIENTRKVKYLKILFQALTSYDKGRIVRRRATVLEVLEFINDESLSIQEFNEIILKFREEGNSFLKPFAGSSNIELTANTVLDITHESLIRNWKILEKWVLEEDENVQTWLEIEKPLKVWKANVKTSKWFMLFSWQFSKVQKYVLPSGLYTLYSRWYKQHPVHLAWLKRISPNYNEESLKDFKNFLLQSRIVLFWNRIQPYLISGIILYFLYLTNQAKIHEANEALKNEKIQKELVLKAEMSASQAIKAKKEADSLKNLAVMSEIKTKEELEYLIEHSSPIVMPDKMNVMYVGVENQFDFAVSGFNTKDIEPVIEVFPEQARNLKCQLKKQSNGSYSLKIPKGAIGVKINAFAKIGNERKMLKGDAPYFRVKLLPDPVAVISGFNNTTKFKASDLKDFKELSAMVLNFDFNIKIKILGFTVSANFGGDFFSASTKGSLFSDEMAKILNRNNAFESDTTIIENPQSVELSKVIKSYKKVVIEDIIASMPDGTTRTLAPLIITIEKD
ncbi:MAG TPA: GldM family protein, partial [Bacteroidia bacterium]|nr:GldM family protein [Bacteroidia bacterium]